MAGSTKIKIGPLRSSELEEANRIMRLAFGTFLKLPDPLRFADDRDMITHRYRSSNTRLFAARAGERLIGSNVATRWGSFGFFGPLTVLPEYWDQGVAQKLLEATEKTFAAWKLRSTALFTFSHSPKHIGLYQKFGYWPTYLTALMLHTSNGAAGSSSPPSLLSTLPRPQREEAIAACARLTGKVEKGLDLTEEIRSLLKNKAGEVVLISTRGTLDGFAVCMTGPGTEGGEKIVYIKFAAARPGPGAGERFDRPLEGCDAFARQKGLPVEAGVNFAREDAYRRMRAHGYKTTVQGVAMQRPHAPAYNRADAYVLDDWR